MNEFGQPIGARIDLECRGNIDKARISEKIIDARTHVQYAISNETQSQNDIQREAKFLNELLLNGIFL